MFLGFFGDKKINIANQKTDTINIDNLTHDKDYYFSNQLVGQASCKEIAEKIAHMSDLKLLDYEYGNALFEITDGREPAEVIEYGKKMGYPDLYISSKGTFLQ